MDEEKLIEAGFDMDGVKERLGGDQDFFKSLLGMVLESSSYDEMIVAFRERKTQEAFEAAHALKGMTGNMGMQKVYEALVPLVEELRAGDFEAAEKLLPSVEERYSKAITAIEDVLEQ